VKAIYGHQRKVLTTDDSSSEILYPRWQEEYQAALLELDDKKLLGRIEAARNGSGLQLLKPLLTDLFRQLWIAMFAAMSYLS
jgi:hypothetical protein